MKFTKTEIDLCREIAEKHKKYYWRPFKYGTWYEYKNHPYLITSQPESEMSSEITILWTISECLEFLKKKINYFQLKFTRKKKFDKRFKFYYRKNWIKPVYYYGKTPLEALLKAVLAILEETSKENNARL